MSDTALLQMDVPLPGTMMTTRHFLQAVSSPVICFRKLCIFGFMNFIIISGHLLVITSFLYQLHALPTDTTPHQVSLHDQ